MKYKSSDHSQLDPEHGEEHCSQLQGAVDGVLQDRQINDNRIVDGDRELPRRWTGFTQPATLNETPSRGMHGSGET